MLTQQVANDIRTNLYPLTCMDNWSCWMARERDGKTQKLPFDPKKGKPARSNDHASWVPYEYAVNTAMHNFRRFPGISFALGEQNVKSGIVGIDIDNCVSNNIIDPDAQKIINTVASYTEYSPSGHGVHIFAVGELPGPSRRANNVEFYDWGRFLTVTGQLICGKLAAVNLSDLYFNLFPPVSVVQAERTQLCMGDDDVITRVMRSRSSVKFSRIWHGDYTGYKSRSEAWYALCSILAFWTQDPIQIARIVAARTPDPKWLDKRGNTTYGELTASRAVATKTTFYNEHYHV